MGLYHCCQPGCLDVLAERSGSAVEEKTHGYLKGHRRGPNGGMIGPRVRVLG
jgi:hypothetical protein